MSSRTHNLLAWALCAPAAIALFALNLVPAIGALIAAPPRPLMAELSSWAIASLVVAAQALRFCLPILLLEVPLALLLALALLRGRGAPPRERPDRFIAVAAVLAGFAWRLLFGGAIGFAASDAPHWQIVALEVWRTLPLATLLLYGALNRFGTSLRDAALLDGASAVGILSRVHLPVCRAAIAALIALQIADYLRALHTPLITSESADRAIWTVLLLIVAILGFRVADQDGLRTPMPIRAPRSTQPSARAAILISALAVGLIGAAAVVRGISPAALAAGAVAALASAALATPLAVALARFHFEGRAIIYALLVVASATSPVLLDHAADAPALGQLIGLGVPIATWFVYLAARTLPANLEAAAELDGSSAVRIWAPLLAPSITAAAALVFLYCGFDLG